MRIHLLIRISYLKIRHHKSLTVDHMLCSFSFLFWVILAKHHNNVVISFFKPAPTHFKKIHKTSRYWTLSLTNPLHTTFQRLQDTPTNYTSYKSHCVLFKSEGGEKKTHNMTKAEYQESNLGCFQNFHTFKIDIKKNELPRRISRCFPFPSRLGWRFNDLFLRRWGLGINGGFFTCP